MIYIGNYDTIVKASIHRCKENLLIAKNSNNQFVAKEGTVSPKEIHISRQYITIT